MKEWLNERTIERKNDWMKERLKERTLNDTQVKMFTRFLGVK